MQEQIALTFVHKIIQMGEKTENEFIYAPICTSRNICQFAVLMLQQKLNKTDAKLLLL